MREFGVIAGVLAVSLTVSGSAAAGEGARGVAGPEFGPPVAEVTRKLGMTRWLGSPEYRCGHYSTVCRYVRPVHRAYFWSVSHRYSALPRVIARDTVRLGRYRLEPPTPVEAASYLPEGHAPARVHRSGGFVRVEAPGKATRWVRSQDLANDK